MAEKPVKPLAQQWLIRVALWMAAYTGVVLIAHWHAGMAQQEDALTAIPRHVQQQFMPQLAQSVWDVDSDTTASLLQGLLDIDGVVHVSITSPQGQLLMQQGSTSQASHQIELPIQASQRSEQNLGALRLSLSFRQLEAKQWQHLALLLSELLLGWLLIALLGYRHLQKRIAQPLQALATQWQTHTPAKAARDEIHALTDVLTHHAAEVQQQQQGLQHDKQELVQQREHLSALLAMRTAELEQLSRFQQMIAETSSRLLTYPSDSLQEEIALALARIGNLLEVDRCYLFRVNSALRIHQTQEWCRSGVTGTAHRYEDYPLHDSAWFIPQLLKQHLVAISQLDDMPPEGQAEKQRFAEHGIQSLAVLTLSSRGQILGFFGCDSVLQKREWQDKELTLMRLIGEMLCSALQQQQQARALTQHKELLAQASEKLDHMVNADGLTGLDNAAILQHQLQLAFHHAQAMARPLGMLLVDIDRLRELNHLAGPMAGDQCIQRVAALLQQHCPTAACRIARSGSNRFTVLLPEHTLQDSIQLAEALREAVWQLAIPHPGSPAAGRVTVSIGVGNLAPQLHHSAEALHDEARQSLYQAKQNGRNCVASTPFPAAPA